MGAPVVTLKLAADERQALVIVRLCDVAPDGTSDRVSYGILNLGHRESSASPEPLEPGKKYCIKVKLKDAAFVISPGHRLRVALSTTYWPMVWPSPRPVRLSVYTGTSTLELPVREPDPGDQKLREFGPPRAPRPVNRRVLRDPNHDWLVTRDLRAEQTTITVMKDDGAFILDSTGLEFDHKGIETYRILDNDPLAASVEMKWTVRYGRGDWRVRIINRAAMTSTEDCFLVTANIAAYEGETRIFSRSFDLNIPRDQL
jgi:hypothetical protein